MGNSQNRHGMRTKLHRGSGLAGALVAVLAWGAATSVATAQEGLSQALKQLSPAPPPGADEEAPQSPPSSDELQGSVDVDEHELVELHVQDEDLAAVLQLLAIRSQRNIIAGPNVSSTVTADIFGATFYEALDAILHPAGYGYIEQGNFIYVYTTEELDRIIQQSRTPIARVVRLNYLSAVDAAEFVKPLLSETGQIKTNGAEEQFTIPDKTPTGAENFASSSTLVVYDFEENVDAIVELLKELDTRPQQVLVEATILQTALTEANAFGVDFSVIDDLSFADFVGIGGPLKVVDGLISGKGSVLLGGSATDVQVPDDRRGIGIASSPGNTAGPGTFKVGIVDDNVAMFLKLLDEVTDTTILSNPKILTLNRQPARVLVGRKVGFLNTTSTDTATVQTVDFLDTGTQLYFRPFVGNDGLIRMELKPQVSEAVIRSVTDTGGVAVTIPDEITNELVTNVMVRDGQTIVLGGLFRESTVATRRQVPVVGDIPVIGAAFRGHDDQTQRTEIIFLITPSIVSEEVLVDQGMRASGQIIRVRTGAREGLLPFSRTRMTGILNVEAERLAMDGQTDKALWTIERSLALGHNQPEAIALRERIIRRHSVWPSGSVMDEAYSGRLHERLERLDLPAPTEPRKTPASEPLSDAGFPFGLPFQAPGVAFPEVSDPIVLPGTVSASVAGASLRVIGPGDQQTGSDQSQTPAQEDGLPLAGPLSELLGPDQASTLDTLLQGDGASLMDAFKSGGASSLLTDDLRAMLTQLGIPLPSADPMSLSGADDDDN